MAIKVSYIFLKSISIAKDLQLFATDGFEFNKNSPIKAVGTLYFIKKDGKITTQKIDNIKEKIEPFSLPQKLNIDIFTDDNRPLYILPAL